MTNTQTTPTHHHGALNTLLEEYGGAQSRGIMASATAWEHVMKWAADHCRERERKVDALVEALEAVEEYERHPDYCGLNSGHGQPCSCFMEIVAAALALAREEARQ